MNSNPPPPPTEEQDAQNFQILAAYNAIFSTETTVVLGAVQFLRPREGWKVLVIGFPKYK